MFARCQFKYSPISKALHPNSQDEKYVGVGDQSWVSSDSVTQIEFDADYKPPNYHLPRKMVNSCTRFAPLFAITWP